MSNITVITPTFEQADENLLNRKRSPKATVGIYGHSLDISGMEAGQQFTIDCGKKPNAATAQAACKRWAKGFGKDWKFTIRVTGNLLTVIRVE